MAYATLAELRDWVGIPAADTADDTKLTLALDAASAAVDQFCDQGFTADGTATVRLYSPAETGQVTVHPISSTTGLVVATDDNNDGTFETTWVLGTDFRLEPANAAAAGEPWTRLVALGVRWFPMLTRRPGVSVTAKFGWPGGVAPAPVKQATLIQAAFLWGRKDARFGVAGSPEFGNEMRVESALDRTAQSLLRAYRRNWWVAP